MNQQFSGVARLGHTGARALATRGGAPPVQVSMQIISADISIVDRIYRALNILEIEYHYQYRYVYPQKYESHTLIVRKFAESNLHCATVWSRNRPGRL